MVDGKFVVVPTQAEYDRSGVTDQQILPVLPRMAPHVELEFDQLCNFVRPGNVAGASKDVDLTSLEVSGASRAAVETRPDCSTIRMEQALNFGSSLTDELARSRDALIEQDEKMQTEYMEHLSHAQTMEDRGEVAS